MATFYPGYDREAAAWAQGRADAWTRTFAAVYPTSHNPKCAILAANEAVKAYEENFPAPEWPGNED